MYSCTLRLGITTISPSRKEFSAIFAFFSRPWVSLQLLGSKLFVSFFPRLFLPFAFQLFRSHYFGCGSNLEVGSLFWMVDVGIWSFPPLHEFPYHLTPTILNASCRTL